MIHETCLRFLKCALLAGSLFGGIVIYPCRASAAPPGRCWRELITVSITEPVTVKPLWINEQMVYRAAATCVDQFSDDGGASWRNFGPDTRSPRPTIVWSTTGGSFLNYSGEKTIYQAQDYSGFETQYFTVVAWATTNGNDIYGAPAVIRPAVPADVPTSQPTLATQPQFKSSTFDAELAAAKAATDRDEQIAHLRQAVVLRPGDVQNLPIEFSIASMLCFNPDEVHHEPVRPADALDLFEKIVAHYHHEDYYKSNAPNEADDPQLMVPRAAVLAASILVLHPDQAAKAQQFAEGAMKDLQWTFDHRRKEWAETPKPVRISPDFETVQEFAGRICYWEIRKQQAASGDAKILLGPDGIALADVAVQMYATNVAAQHPNEVPVALGHLIEEFRNTPMAEAAQKEIVMRQQTAQKWEAKR